MQAWTLKATFADGWGAKTYTSPDVRLRNPGWSDEIFNRPIERLEFALPTGHRILIAGMQSYNIFVEASQSLSGGTPKLEAIWICGRLPRSETVLMWRIADGRVVQRQGKWGREWGGTPTRGWKSGAIGTNPTSMIVGG